MSNTHTKKNYRKHRVQEVQTDEEYSRETDKSNSLKKIKTRENNDNKVNLNQQKEKERI